MRRAIMIPVLVAVALLFVTAPVLAEPAFEFPFLQRPGVGASISSPVSFNSLPAPFGVAPTPTVLDDRSIK